MPWPDLELTEDFETFFEPTRIWLFGKEFKSLRYVRESMFEEFTPFTPDPINDAVAAKEAKDARDAKDAKEPKDAAKAKDPKEPNKYGHFENSLAMPPRRIERTMRRAGVSDDKTLIERLFARIYSFSFEGYYYKLPRPMLFLVSGSGDPLEAQKQAAQDQARAAAGESPDAMQQKARKRRNPSPGRKPQDVTNNDRLKFNTKYTGLDAREWTFSEDIRVWQVDRKDMAVCLDIEIGNYQEILLDTMIAAARRAGASRGEIGSRGEAASRGEVGSRGAGSFRGEIVGPHHNW